MADDARGDRVRGLAMLASALAGRAVAVAELQPGEPPWTDGQTIYVDPVAPDRARLASVAVQASLIAAGSLDPAIVRALVRHPRLARRYLAVEGHRALVSNADVLPGILASVGDRGVAGRSDSPAASLRIASGRGAVEVPRPEFGVIRAAKVVTAASRLAPQRNQAESQHVPRNSSEQKRELEELDDGDVDDSDDPDLFTSPVGGGGFIGKWLKKMLSSARKTGSGGGPPGADGFTHRTNSTKRGAYAVASLASAPGTRGTSRTPSRTACGIRNGMWRARATGPHGAPCARSNPRSRPPRHRPSTTPSVCAGHFRGSAWGCTAGTGSRKATTSTSMPPSKPGSKCGPARCPTRRCTSTACGAGATCRCCCCSTCRGRRANRERSGGRSTSNSAPRSPTSPWPCTTWATASRSTPTTRRAGAR
ncbi:hypothetical protein I548_3998 [Mycobacterium intracellulare]|nr:hypothetical protein I548_3998 [Mycobacterium intracellulare]